MADTLFHSLDKYKPNLTSNFCMRLAHRTLGRSKLKYSWQCLTVSMLLVLNSFIKNLLMTKSRACKFDLVKGQASRPYKRTGLHLF